MLVIGNGESRIGVDIGLFNKPTIGCNAIYRDFHVDHLVCVDKRMLQEALTAGVNTEGCYVYTRNDWYDQYRSLKVRLVPDLPYVGMERPDNPFHWGSGPYAVLLGAKLSKNNLVEMIGFDLYSADGKINNVYKDTQNYSLSIKSAVDPRYWIYQIGKVFENFPNTQFIVYTKSEWQKPKSWNHPNVKVDSISNISYNT